MTRTDIEFLSHGQTCRGWLCLPAGERPPAGWPTVVMAHGFGATRECGLLGFAEHFAAAGFAALIFDYRHFGASDGRPRQLLSITRQLQDWHAAIAWARGAEGLDGSRLVAWGTSFSGGHALMMGAREPDLAAIVCQCPMMDGLAASGAVVQYGGLGLLLRVVGHGLLDLAAALGGGAHYVPSVGPTGTTAMMTSADADSGYRAMAPEGFDFRVAARVGLTLWSYRPVTQAGRVRCPALLLLCDHDTVAPVRAAEAVAMRLGERAEVKRYPVGHFDVYQGEAFARSVADQVEFLQRHLG